MCAVKEQSLLMRKIFDDISYTDHRTVMKLALFFFSGFLLRCVQASTLRDSAAL